MRDLVFKELRDCNRFIGSELNEAQKEEGYNILIATVKKMLELCYIAKGEVELFFEFRVFPWDYAAACLILREAGGYICAFNGAKLPFDKPSMVIAANNEENFRKLTDTVNKYVDKIPYTD